MYLSADISTERYRCFYLGVPHLGQHFELESNCVAQFLQNTIELAFEVSGLLADMFFGTETLLFGRFNTKIKIVTNKAIIIIKPI